MMMKKNNNTARKISGAGMRFIALIMTLMMTIGIVATPVMAFNTTVQADPTNANFLLDGESVAFHAYNIGGHNFFKLRDLAYALSGTPAQFDVGWDGYTNSILITRGIPYTITSGEMILSPNPQSRTATPTTSTIILVGYGQVTPRGYLIGANNFFMLREMTDLLGFSVDWDGYTSTILIDTHKQDYQQTHQQSSQHTNIFERLEQPSTLTFTNDELVQLIQVTPSHLDTRSSIVLPARRPTQSELDEWKAEYMALGGKNAWELEVVRLINELRAEHGLHPLVICLGQSMRARFHAQSMEDLNFLGHQNPYWAERSGFYGVFAGGSADRSSTFGVTGVGENIGGARLSPASVVEGWMDSPGHRGAILNSRAYTVGVGAVQRGTGSSARTVFNTGR